MFFLSGNFVGVFEECPVGQLSAIEALGLVGQYLEAQDPDISRWCGPRSGRTISLGGDSLGRRLFSRRGKTAAPADANAA
jgi:hypothetical protein